MIEPLLSWVDRHYLAIIVALGAVVFFGPAITNGLVRLFTKLGWLNAAAWVAAKGPGFIGKLKDLEDAIVERETTAHLERNMDALVATNKWRAVMLDENTAELEAVASVSDDPNVVALALKHREKVGGVPTKSLPPIA